MATMHVQLSTAMNNQRLAAKHLHWPRSGEKSEVYGEEQFYVYTGCSLVTSCFVSLANDRVEH